MYGAALIQSGKHIPTLDAAEGGFRGSTCQRFWRVTGVIPAGGFQVSMYASRYSACSRSERMGVRRYSIASDQGSLLGTREWPLVQCVDHVTMAVLAIAGWQPGSRASPTAENGMHGPQK